VDIWALCENKIKLKPIQRQVYRIVENQQQIATTHIVDTLEEQLLLEEMIEKTKPELAKNLSNRHYLMSTPFRYPPLRYGSRFGTRYQPSLFYGSLSKETLFAESSFYRFVFWYGMQTPPKSQKLMTQHTVFSVDIKFKSGLVLQGEPFSKYKSQLRHKQKYSDTQLLGRQMREHKVVGFEFASARCDEGVNVGLFSIDAISSKKPKLEEAWLCETRANAVVYVNPLSREKMNYQLDHYLVRGKLPFPSQ